MIKIEHFFHPIAALIGNGECKGRNLGVRKVCVCESIAMMCNEAYLIKIQKGHWGERGESPNEQGDHSSRN